MSIRPEALEPSAQGHHVEVSVEVLHSPPHSSADRLLYIYFITVQNLGQHPVQLLERHWEITDGDGSLKVVDGEGVIGQQPVIPPGERFIYNSAVSVRVPDGLMRGHYTFVTDMGERFRVDVPAFALYTPDGWTSSERITGGPSNPRMLN